MSTSNRCIHSTRATSCRTDNRDDVRERQGQPPHTAARATGGLSTISSAVMAATKMLRVSDRTHDGFRREGQRRGATIDEVAAAALRALRQKETGGQLAAPIDGEEAEWLAASLR